MYQDVIQNLLYSVIRLIIKQLHSQQKYNITEW